MRRLIINADDFGMTAGVNRAIIESHRAGTVTSCTLMANEAAVEDAVAIASRTPSLGVGCHVVLVDGQPLSPPDRVPSLIGSRNRAHARFRSGVAHLALATILGRLKPADVLGEVSAQIERLQSAGLMLSHVDCHMHSHILPVVARAVLQTAREHGIRAVRNPFEPPWAVGATYKSSSPRSWNRSAQITILRALEPQFLNIVRDNGMKTTDGTIGIAVTGLLDHDLFERLIDVMPEGTWELVTHPGYNDQDLAHATTELKQSRAVEMELLSSAGTLDLLRSRGIQLIGYREL